MLKVRLIGLHFMDLRVAPTPLRLLFEGYVLAVFAAGRLKESDAIDRWFAEPVSAAYGGQLLFLAQALSPQADRVLPASPSFDGVKWSRSTGG